MCHQYIHILHTYRKSDPPSTSHEKLSCGSVIYTGNPTPRNNRPNPVPNVPSEPDSDPSSSDSSSLDSSQSSDLDILNNDDTRKKPQSKKRFNDPIKKCASLTAKLLKDAYNLTATKFKFDEDTLQRQVYFLPFMSSL